MACEFLNRWNCNQCSLKDDKKREVVKCNTYDYLDMDCSMPIQIKMIKEEK